MPTKDYFHQDILKVWLVTWIYQIWPPTFWPSWWNILWLGIVTRVTTCYSYYAINQQTKSELCNRTYWQCQLQNGFYPKITTFALSDQILCPLLGKYHVLFISAFIMAHLISFSLVLLYDVLLWLDLAEPTNHFLLIHLNGSWLIVTWQCLNKSILSRFSTMRIWQNIRFVKTLSWSDW